MPDFVGHGKKTIPAAQELGGMFYPEYSLFKSLPALFDQIVHTVEGNELLWAVLANLKPSGRIIPHIDNHTLASCYRRIHVPIQSDEGNYLISGGEKHHMKIGEVWFFNNYVLHEGANDSTRPRLHLILDIKVDDE